MTLWLELAERRKSMVDCSQRFPTRKELVSTGTSARLGCYNQCQPPVAEHRIDARILAAAALDEELPRQALISG